MSRPTPKALVYAMYDRYQQGFTLREVCCEFDVCYETVRQNFIRYNLPLRSRVHSLMAGNRIQQETREMYRDYKAGMSLRKLGKKYCYSPQAVRQRFLRRGLARRPIGNGGLER